MIPVSTINRLNTTPTLPTSVRQAEERWINHIGVQGELCEAWRPEGPSPSGRRGTARIRPIRLLEFGSGYLIWGVFGPTGKQNVLGKSSEERHFAAEVRRVEACFWKRAAS